MEKDIYSEKNLMSFLKEFATYLWKVDLYKDVGIYTMNKLYEFGSKDEENPPHHIIHIDGKSFTMNQVMIGNVPMYVLDNIAVSDMLEHYNPKSLNVTMDSKLCDYLYYGDFDGADVVRDKVEKIFEKHGFYIEYGSSWYMYAEEISNN